jgi:hypothetical protein
MVGENTACHPHRNFYLSQKMGGQTRMTPWLSQDEIDDLCAPLKQHAAQLRFVRGLGITVREKPNGAPLVMRAHFEETMAPAGKKRSPAKCVPDFAGLRLAHTRG